VGLNQPSCPEDGESRFRRNVSTKLYGVTSQETVARTRNMASEAAMDETDSGAHGLSA
jgi:hypothetical protein